MPWLKNNIRTTPVKLALLCCLTGSLLSSAGAFSQSSSVLSKGSWYKIGVTKTGIYKMDAAWFGALGIDLGSVQVALYGNGSGILPQVNSVARPADLQPNAVWIDTRSDGSPEAVYFYGEGPAAVTYDPASKRYRHEVNPYTDTTYYFLTVGSMPGLRMESYNPPVPASYEIVNTFENYWFYEKEAVNLLKSGREWWGDYLGTTPSLNLEPVFPGLIPGSEALLSFGGIASAQTPTRFLWQVDGAAVGEQAAGTVSTYRYDLKAQKAEASFQFKVGTGASEKLKLNVTYDKNGQAGASAYLDYVSLQVRCRLGPYSAPAIFRIPPAAAGNRVLEFGAAGGDFILWDVTDPLKPAGCTLQKKDNGTFWVVQQAPAAARSYIGFKKEQAVPPQAVKKIPNQDIRAQSPPDMIIVTAREWADEAGRLASFRESHDGLDVLTVTIEEVFNEFGGGKPDVTAIRDLCRHFYQSGRLKYLLLFGDATFDFRNKKGGETDPQFYSRIPSYQSRESLHPVYTFTSDDYYGFLADGSGEWKEDASGDHLLQIGIGRLPVKSREEAKRVTDKLIDYSSRSVMGKWRNRIAFVADNGDNNIHQQHADQLARLVTDKFLPSRIFIDEYPLTATSLGNRAPAVNKEIRKKVNEGSLILNFTGHGDESGWTDEKIFTLADMQALQGYENMPLFVTATCEFGRYDDPSVVSGAELLLLSPRGAAIGAMTTTRPVFSSTNFSINQAFYNAIRQGLSRLGDIVKVTKNNSLAGALNRNFVLLGDPSMKLAIPELPVRWTSVPDTLRAAGKTTLKGEIYDPASGAADLTFTGTAYVTVFDQPVQFKTLGAPGPAATYEEYRNRIFEGRVSVLNGKFEVNFVAPGEEAAGFRKGLVSVYAHTSDGLRDAAGRLEPLLGPAADLPGPDTKAPLLTAFLNTGSFRDGDLVEPFPTLYADISDDTGLRISGSAGTCGMTAVLNDTLPLPIHDYYSSDLDSYLGGKVAMPLDISGEGEYSLVISFCDIAGNSAQKKINFRIRESKSLAIRSSVVFPNPFTDNISYRLAHNRPGHDLEVSFKLFTRTGQLIFSDLRTYYNASGLIESGIMLGNEIKPELQIYLYEVTLRSLQDKTTGRVTGKLIRRH